MALPTFTAGRKLRASELATLLKIQAKTYEGVCSSSVTIGTALADVTGATVTFTTATASALAVIIWTGDFNTTVAGAGVIALVQTNTDGVDYAPRQLLRDLNATGRITLSQRLRLTLGAAGSHTIKLRTQKTGAGGTVQLGVDHTGLTVTVHENP